jgi:urea transport system ATP-binding protein
VFENIELALKGDRRTFSLLFTRTRPDEMNHIAAVLDRIRLSHLHAQMAGTLSHGQKQWLEIGMLLAQEPKLMMLDEPVAGMTDAETEETAAMLLEITRDHSMIVVEHDMAFVRALGAKVTVLHEGSVLAEGSIDHVQSNERVVEVYLGR